MAEERKAWRKSHPHTDWEGGHYPIALHFCEDYPTKPPICRFPKDFFHPNVYLSGMVCLSILSSEGVPAEYKMKVRELAKQYPPPV